MKKTITFERALNAPDCYVVCLVERREVNGTNQSLFWDLLNEEYTHLVQREEDIIELSIQFGAYDDDATGITEARIFLDANCGCIFIEDSGYFD